VSIHCSFPPDSRTEERARMVRDQIERRGLMESRTLEAMRAVPRHLFLPEERRSSAYADFPLPIGSGQTISQPYIVAYMTDALHLQGGEKVLEIGTGSGYQTTVLACLAREVHSIERIGELADAAQKRLLSLGVPNVRIHTGDGTLGLPGEAPFDAILVTAGSPSVPVNLLEQLAPAGRLLAPVGGRDVQTLELYRRMEHRFDRERLIAVVFVPLIGDQGWRGESPADSDAGLI
jgi:protein-L-isoaspartate(D-aspartate) O-methyltransferase